MAEFVTGSFNTMDPRLLSPIQQAIASYGNLQRNALARQQARQTGIENQFMPQLLHEKLAQQQIYTSRYPELLRAQASSISPTGALAQVLSDYLAKQKASTKSALGTVGHAAASPFEGIWNFLTTPHTERQPTLSTAPDKTAQESQAAPSSKKGYVEVNVNGQKVLYNPKTKDWRAA